MNTYKQILLMTNNWQEERDFKLLKIRVFSVPLIISIILMYSIPRLNNIVWQFIPFSLLLLVEIILFHMRLKYDNYRNKLEFYVRQLHNGGEIWNDYENLPSREYKTIENLDIGLGRIDCKRRLPKIYKLLGLYADRDIKFRNYIESQIKEGFKLVDSNTSGGEINDSDDSSQSKIIS